MYTIFEQRTNSKYSLTMARRSTKDLSKLPFEHHDQYESAESLHVDSNLSNEWSPYPLTAHKLMPSSQINELYEFVEPLGPQKRCSVWKARHRETEQLMALKAIVVDPETQCVISSPPSLSRQSSRGSNASSTTAFSADPQEQLFILLFASF